jgi:glycosyltransferase involved in cell wall biosynthesis
MAKIDIIVPCYNYGRFLSSCVSSILEQSIHDLRVLIIDDASLDDTLAAARKLAEADLRVDVISHSQNWGHIRTYNEGIAWASADYFMLLSADDLLVPGALERAVSILDAHPDVVLTYGGSINLEQGRPLPDAGEQSDYTWTWQEGLHLINAYCSSGLNFIVTPTVITRTCIQKAIGDYRPYLPHTGDMEMWLRFAANGAVARINAVQAIYRRHSSNMSGSYLIDYQERKEAFDSFFFGGYADHLPSAQTLQAKADRILAERAFCTGLAHLCQGNVTNGRRLLQFAINLRPGLRYWPPIGYIAQKPDLYKRVVRLFRDSLENFFERNRQK